MRSLRPICVYPVFYRVWSACWIKSETLKPLRQLAPLGCFGHANVKGPEALAATIDCLAEEWGQACSLDFSHAFDVVNVNVLQQSLKQILNGQSLQWMLTLTDHWKNTDKWLGYNRNFGSTPYRSDLGIPGGPRRLCKPSYADAAFDLWREQSADWNPGDLGETIHLYG